MSSPREKNPPPFPSGRVFCQCLLALLLLALIQAPHLASSLEDLSPVFPPASRLASLLTRTSETSGLAPLGREISAFFALFSTDQEAGELPASLPAPPLPARAERETDLPSPAGPRPPQQAADPLRLSVARTSPPPPVSAPPLVSPAPEVRPDGGKGPSSGSAPAPERQSPVSLAMEPSVSTLSFRTVASLSLRTPPPEAPGGTADAVRPLRRGTDPGPPAVLPPARRRSASAAEYSASGTPAGILSPPPLRNPLPASGAAAVRSPLRSARAPLPPPPAAKDPEDAFHILLTGDSMMMEGLGPALTRALQTLGKVKISRDAKYSTGLSRRDYFDWSLHMAALAEQHAPDLIVISLGGNDSQDIVDVAQKRHWVGTPSWERHYLLRARELVAAARKNGALALWVGLPVMGNSPHARYTLQISRQQQAACSDPSSEVFVDTLPVLADPKGGYLTYAQSAKGVQTRVRQKDKIHVTDAGGDLLAAAVLPHAEAMLQRIAGHRRAALLAGQAALKKRSRLENPALAVTSRRIPADGALALSPQEYASRTAPGDLASSLSPRQDEGPLPRAPAGAAPRPPGG